MNEIGALIPGNGLFNPFSQSSYRCELKAYLSEFLHDAVGRDAITNMNLDALEAESSESIAERLLQPVQIPAVEIAENHQIYGAPHEGPDLWVEEVNSRVRSMVWTIGWQVSGPSERLLLWPRDALPMPPTNDELRAKANAPFSASVWGFPNSVFTHDQGVVYTYIVTTSETDVDSWIDQIEGIAAERRQVLLQLVDAQASQEASVLAEVTERLQEMCNSRRDMLDWERTKSRALELSPDRLEIPTLQPVDARGKNSSVEEQASGVNGEAQEPNTVESEEVALNRYEFDRVSFEAIIDSIDRWGRAVEEGAGNLQNFSEDGLTTALCAGLTIAYGIALHSVFVHQGKSDIYVPMEVVAKLNGVPVLPDQEHAFIAEAKKRSGPKVAEDALDQLDRYLPNRVPRGALVFYLTNANFAQAQSRILSALRGRAIAKHEWNTAGGVPVIAVWDEQERINREIGVVCISIPARDS